MYKKINIGLFKSTPEMDGIKISADVYGLIEIQDSFRSLANGIDHFNFSDLRFFENSSSINIVGFSDTTDVGLKLTGNGAYEWRVTKGKWNEFRDKLLKMCYQNSEKNIQFESGAKDKDDLQVAFSFDEFNQF